MDRITDLFQQKKNNILSIYFTAGYPSLTDTKLILKNLQESGADMVEIGIPFSDPLADGPVIQQSSKQALQNGMTLKLLFEQLHHFREEINMSVILMGYLNPVLQFGMEAFLQQCKDTGIDGVILPDMPLQEYEEQYQSLFEKYEMNIIFLVTPETSDERLKKIDSLSKGFVYAVSSSSTTGKDKDMEKQINYFKRLKDARLQNPVLVGFGIKDKNTFETACRYTNGAIIGTAYIKALHNSKDIAEATSAFIQQVKEK